MALNVRVFCPALLLVSIAMSGAGVVHAQTAVCPGPLKEPHPFGAFNFDTNSRQQPPSLGGFKSEIVSCVSNLDRDNPLHVNWLIPGPHGWAPAGNILESVAREIKEDHVLPLKGCLEYGNRGDTDYGHFLGVESDQEKIEDEARRGCRAVAARPKSSESVLGNLLLPFKNFFPSDIARPKETLLQMEGTIRIEIRGADSYQSVIRYRMSRYPGSEGNPSEIVFRPAFQGEAEGLLGAFRRRNDDVVKGDGDGQIAFEVSDIRNPQLLYTSYDVLDRGGHVVAAIDFPVFVSRR